MSTPLDIVRRALRTMGVLKRGKEPTGSDLADGIEKLQSVVLQFPGLLHNGRWREVAVDGAYTAREGDRCTVSGAGSVTLPAVVEDCRTGAARPPLDMAKVQIIGDAPNAGLWVYSATRSAWGRVDAITVEGANEPLPFGPEDEEGLAAILATNWVDEYGAEISARTVALAQIATGSLRSRFKRAEPPDPSRPGMSCNTKLDYC
jgi:hypothetical protein